MARYERRNIIEVFKHENFSADTMENNISLVKTESIKLGGAQRGRKAINKKNKKKDYNKKTAHNNLKPKKGTKENEITNQGTSKQSRRGKRYKKVPRHSKGKFRSLRQKKARKRQRNRNKRSCSSSCASVGFGGSASGSASASFGIGGFLDGAAALGGLLNTGAAAANSAAAAATTAAAAFSSAANSGVQLANSIGSAVGTGLSMASNALWFKVY